MTGPVLPQNPEAEDNLLAAILLAGATSPSKAQEVARKVSETGVQPGDFFSESNGHIFQAQLALVERGSPTDYISVAEELRRQGRLDYVGGDDRLKMLAGLAASTANAPHYGRLVLEAARNRRAAKDLRAMVQELDEGTIDMETMAARMSATVGAARSKSSLSVKSFDAALASYVEEQQDPSMSSKVRLGFGSLDADTRGIGKEQVGAIGARAAVGKTSMLMSIAENASANPDCGILLCSLEQPATEIVEKALAIHSDVAPEQVEEWAKEGRIGENLGDFLDRMQNVRIYDEPVSLAALPSVLASARDQLPVPLRLLLVDYLGLISADGRSPYERTSSLAQGMKQLAKSEKIAVLLAMQLSRAGGDGSIPVTSDMLRDSGVLEESVDFLFGAWRPGKAQGLDPVESLNLKHTVRVALLKNRRGPEGRIVDLQFIPSRRLIEEATYGMEAA